MSDPYIFVVEPDPYPPADVDPHQLKRLAAVLKMVLEPGEVPEWRLGPWPGWGITTRASGPVGLQVFTSPGPCPCPHHFDHDEAECEDQYPALTRFLRPVEWMARWEKLEAGTPAQALAFALENGAETQPRTRSKANDPF